jgi:predicted metal-dependent hydrolase
MYYGWDCLPHFLSFGPATGKNKMRPKGLISFIMQDTENFQYKIVFSHRRTISINIRPDPGVVVKAPYRTPIGTIHKFVTAKSVWIIKTLDKFNSLVRLDNQKGYSNDDSILLFGREHKLKLIQSDKYSVSLSNNDTIEAGFNKDSNPLIIRAHLEDWFKFVARRKLTAQFQEILTKYKDYGFLPAGFVVRTMKTRWGSCSSKGKIAISYDLIRLNEIYSEYVIIHELCHLKHHNHSASYYKLLSEVYPNWKKVRKELQKYIR